MPEPVMQPGSCHVVHNCSRPWSAGALRPDSTAGSGSRTVSAPSTASCQQLKYWGQVIPVGSKAPVFSRTCPTTSVRSFRGYSHRAYLLRSLHDRCIVHSHQIEDYAIRDKAPSEPLVTSGGDELLPRRRATGACVSKHVSEALQRMQWATRAAGPPMGPQHAC